MKDVFKKIVVAILTFEAGFLLKRKKPRIIAVTGSVGKTSTKDAIYTVITEKVRARKSQKSFNSDLGVPLTVLGIPNGGSNPIVWMKSLLEGLAIALFSRQYPDWLVLEMGVDRPGDMKALTAWIKPDIVVMTRLPDVPVHVEYFETPEDVIAEKLILVDALKSDGILIYNHDDERARLAAGDIRQQSIGYSRYSKSDFTASKDVMVYEEGKAVGIEYAVAHGEETTIVHINGVLGSQYAHTATAALAVGSVLGIPLQEAAEALRSHVPSPGRMRLLAGVKETLIIDDTYNSSPIAAAQALQTLRELKKVKRKIAVMGDMLELGRYSIDEHKKIGEMAAGIADILVTIGVRARAMAEAALAAGMSEENIFQYEDSVRAGKEIEEMLHKGDAVLVKGSQSIRTERVVEEIMAEPERAPELLVRQDGFWK